MIIIIKFYHKNQQVSANAIFDLKETNTTVIVDLFKCTDELGEQILLIKQDGKWITDSDIVTKFRSTYLNLLNEINWIYHQNTLKAINSKVILS